MKMDITKAAIELLGALEGFNTKSYQDEGGNWTVGVGHLVTGPQDPSLLLVTGLSVIDPARVTLTPWQVNDLLYIDLKSRIAQANSLLTRPVEQSQFDAIIDFVFNMGIGTLKNGVPSKGKESLLVAVNEADDVQHMCDVLYQYSTYKDQFCDGRLKRRYVEACLFNYPESVERPDELSDKAYADAMCILKKYKEAIINNNE